MRAALAARHLREKGVEVLTSCKVEGFTGSAKVEKVLTDHGEVDADLVVLATAVVPRLESGTLADMLGLATDAYGYLNAADEELSPLESGVPGVFLAGAVSGPKDIPEVVAQASGAAAKVLTFLRRNGPRPAPIALVDGEAR